MASLVATSLVSSIALATVPDTPGPSPSREYWSWRDERFSADLLVTNKHDELVQQWNSLASDPEQWPTVAVVDSARRGEKVHAIVIFRGCMAPGRPCGMELDYFVLKPDGTRYGDFPDRVLWSEATPVPDPRLVYLGGPYLEFMADPGDPFGEYEFVVRIRSLENPEGIELRRTLRVTPE